MRGLARGALRRSCGFETAGATAHNRLRRAAPPLLILGRRHPTWGSVSSVAACASCVRRPAPLPPFPPAREVSASHLLPLGPPIGAAPPAPRPPPASPPRSLAGRRRGRRLIASPAALQIGSGWCRRSRFSAPACSSSASLAPPPHRAPPCPPHPRLSLVSPRPPADTIMLPPVMLAAAADKNTARSAAAAEAAAVTGLPSSPGGGGAARRRRQQRQGCSFSALYPSPDTRSLHARPAKARSGRLLAARIGAGGRQGLCGNGRRTKRLREGLGSYF